MKKLALSLPLSSQLVQDPGSKEAYRSSLKLSSREDLCGSDKQQLLVSHEASTEQGPSPVPANHTMGMLGEPPTWAFVLGPESVASLGSR